MKKEELNIIKEEKREKKKLPKGISQRPNGRYIIRITRKNYKPIVKYKDTLEEAIKLRNELEEKMKNGEFDQCNKSTSDKSLMELFYEDIEKDERLKLSTRRVYMQYWNNYLDKSKLAKMTVEEVKSKDVRELYRELSKRELSKRTYNTISSIIKRIYKYASYISDVDYIPPTKDVMRGIRVNKPKVKEVISREDEELLVQYMKENHMEKYVYLFKFLLQTGVRIGEAIGLTTGDIEDQWIQINKTLKYCKLEKNKNYLMYLSSPKTERSTRKIPMTDGIRMLIEGEKERQRKLGISCLTKVAFLDDSGKKIGEVSDFVFLNKKGKPYTEEMFRSGLRRAIDGYNRKEEKKSVIENRQPNKIRYIAPHETRHTYISRLVSKGVNPAAVAKIVGHERVETTLNFYTHVSDNDIIEATKEIG